MISNHQSLQGKINTTHVRNVCVPHKHSINYVQHSRLREFRIVEWGIEIIIVVKYNLYTQNGMLPDLSRVLEQNEAVTIVQNPRRVALIALAACCKLNFAS